MKQSISLLDKLDAFIRQYHRNKALRGVLLSFATLTAGALALAALEHVGRFGVAGRTVLFYAFAAVTIGVLLTQVVWPVLQWMRVSRGLGYDEAARIVGNHFPEVKDKLLNTLQLQQQVDNAQGADVTLLAASIDQRTASLQATSVWQGRGHSAFPSSAEIRGALRRGRGRGVLDAPGLGD